MGRANPALEYVSSDTPAPTDERLAVAAAEEPEALSGGKGTVHPLRLPEV